MLEAADVSVGSILRSVTLSLASGRVAGLVGPNGAGKTTMIRVLAGLLPPSRGEVRLEGTLLSEWSRAEIARRIAVVFQDAPPIAGFRVLDIVRMGRFPHVRAWRGPGRADADAVDRALRLTGIESLADRPHQTLSGGEQQLVQIARALAQQPRVLLMDEPAANLDVSRQQELGKRLKAMAAEGIGVLISTHDINSVLAWCDRALLLSAGRLLADDQPSRALTPERLRESFGVSPTAAELPDGSRLYSFL
jgi:iron complex transport system ATP-binding protein